MTDELHDDNDVIEAAHWLAELQTAVSETVAGVLLRASRPVPVVPAKVLSSPGALVGYAIRNLTAAPIDVLIREYDAGGMVVLPIVIAANGSATADLGAGVNFVDGIYVDAPADSVDGSVFLRGPE